MPYFLLRTALEAPVEIELPSGITVFDNAQFANPRRYITAQFAARAFDEGFSYFSDFTKALTAWEEERSKSPGYLPCLVYVSLKKLLDARLDARLVTDKKGNIHIFFANAKENKAPFAIETVYAARGDLTEAPSSDHGEAILFDDSFRLWHEWKIPVLKEHPLNEDLVNACKSLNLIEIVKLLKARVSPNGDTSLLNFLIEKAPHDTPEARKAVMIASTLLLLYGEKSLYDQKAHEGLSREKPELYHFITSMIAILHYHGFKGEAYSQFEAACLEGNTNAAFECLKTVFASRPEEYAQSKMSVLFFRGESPSTLSADSAHTVYSTTASGTGLSTGEGSTPHL